MKKNQNQKPSSSEERCRQKSVVAVREEEVKPDCPFAAGSLATGAAKSGLPAGLWANQRICR